MPRNPSNSLQFKILPVTPCSPEIFSQFPANSMIPENHGGGVGASNANHPRANRTPVSSQRPPLPASENQRNPVRIARTSPQPFLLLPQTLSRGANQTQLRSQTPQPRQFRLAHLRGGQCDPGLSHADHAPPRQRSNRS